MKKRSSGAARFRPPIEVRPWADPISGNVFYSVNGPMLLADPKLRVMTHGELRDLKAKIDAALTKVAG
ncbi:hypothetical protein [uncultured Cohaesibacter sp.]|uniref:hypothetical protein n=1 Tax=uncultured Cohaesibacter sp. TaxID=1002546 RepID=UPI002AA6D57C|nr:hypothetical protein [uncultured Cohaesibacter sp.]